MGQRQAFPHTEFDIDMIPLIPKPDPYNSSCSSRERIVTAYLPAWKVPKSSAISRSPTTPAKSSPLNPAPQLYPLKLRTSATPPRPSPSGRLNLPPSPTDDASRLIPIGGRKAAERRAMLALEKAEAAAVLVVAGK